MRQRDESPDARHDDQAETEGHPDPSHGVAGADPVDPTADR